MTTETAVPEATCIVCGCTDSRACPDGCSWVYVNRETGKGLCSACDENRDSWEPDA